MDIFITIDYELFFGSYIGNLEKSLINPTNKLLKILDKHNIKVSFFIDSGYIIKLNEYREKYNVLEKDYQKIINQIDIINKKGHDIQLHIHPHWEDSYFNGFKWVMNTSRYRLSQYKENEIYDIVYRYKKILTNIVGEHKVFSFRAGGWCLQPFDKLKKAFKKNNIWLDSTVFYGGKNKSITHYFDFSKSPQKSIWKFEDNPLSENKNGFFTEIPISSYKVSPLFFWKFIFAKKLGGDKHKPFGDGVAAGGSKFDKIRMLTKYSNSVVSIDGYKISFLQDAFNSFVKKKKENFVIIGHPKSMTAYSISKLEEFLLRNITSTFTTYLKKYQTIIK